MPVVVAGRLGDRQTPSVGILYLGSQPSIQFILPGLFTSFPFPYLPNSFPCPVKGWLCASHERPLGAMATVFLGNCLALPPREDPEGGSFIFPTHFGLTLTSNEDLVHLLETMRVIPLSTSLPDSNFSGLPTPECFDHYCDNCYYNSLFATCC